MEQALYAPLYVILRLGRLECLHGEVCWQNKADEVGEETGEAVEECVRMREQCVHQVEAAKLASSLTELGTVSKAHMLKKTSCGAYEERVSKRSMDHEERDEGVIGRHPLESTTHQGEETEATEGSISLGHRSSLLELDELRVLGELCRASTRT